MKILKATALIVVSVILTTFSIDATDTLSGKGQTLLAQLSGIEVQVCPDGMVHIASALTFSCVDEYEVSVGDECIISNPENQINTEVNISKQDCRGDVNKDKEPWTFISREQAQIMCARAGKRLPSANEWYQYALGTDKSKCNINSIGVSVSSKSLDCISAVGVKNTVGNVWEWVSDDVVDGIYEGRKLPETGYVVQVDSDGMATVTSSDNISSANNIDGYFWSNATGTYAIIRGGFYGSRGDASVFNTHTYTSPNFASAGIGFRCIR